MARNPSIRSWENKSFPDCYIFDIGDPAHEFGFRAGSMTIREGAENGFVPMNSRGMADLLTTLYTTRFDKRASPTEKRIARECGNILREDILDHECSLGTILTHQGYENYSVKHERHRVPPTTCEGADLRMGRVERIGGITGEGILLAAKTTRLPNPYKTVPEPGFPDAQGRSMSELFGPNAPLLGHAHQSLIGPRLHLVRRWYDEVSLRKRGFPSDVGTRYALLVDQEGFFMVERPESESNNSVITFGVQRLEKEQALKGD